MYGSFDFNEDFIFNINRGNSVERFNPFALDARENFEFSVVGPCERVLGVGEVGLGGNCLMSNN
jgi:hypothetical protein